MKRQKQSVMCKCKVLRRADCFYVSSQMQLRKTSLASLREIVSICAEGEGEAEVGSSRMESIRSDFGEDGSEPEAQLD